MAKKKTSIATDVARTWRLYRKPKVLRRYLRRNYRGVSEPYLSASAMLMFMGGFLIYHGNQALQGDDRIFVMGLGGAGILSGINIMMAGRRITDQQRYEKKRDAEMNQLVTEIRDILKAKVETDP